LAIVNFTMGRKKEKAAAQAAAQAALAKAALAKAASAPPVQTAEPALAK
jgi:hypothetical protein